jgi:galactoside O-acetyltransferase
MWFKNGKTPTILNIKPYICFYKIAKQPMEAKKQTSFYDPEELRDFGFKSIGSNVYISRKASFYGAEKMQIGDNVRIDDFCILSGNIEIGSNIHISAYCALYGGMGIRIEDYSGLSARCTVYSAVDDFSGNYLIGPMVNPALTNVTGGTVTIKKFVQVGAGTVIMPAVTLNEGVAVGSMSFINKTLDQWTIYAGCPVKKIKDRSKKAKLLAGE